MFCLRQLIIYAIVGVTGLVIGLGALQLLMKAGFEFIIANMLTFFVAVTWNFAGHCHWTFGMKEHFRLRPWAEYVMGCLGAAVVNWTVAGGVFYFGGPLAGRAMAAALVGVAVGSLGNFLWARQVVFARDGTYEAC